MEVNPRYENRIIGENPNGNDGRNERVNKLKKNLVGLSQQQNGSRREQNWGWKTKQGNWITQ